MTSARAARSRAPPTTRRRSRRVERIPKVNDAVDIWWAVDKTFYRGRLTNQLHNNTSFRILYDDGETEDLDLVKEHWKFAHDDKPNPDAHEIVDIVLDGSHHPSQDSKATPVPKKTKQKSSKSPATRLKGQQASDNESAKDYAEEQSTPMHTTREKRSKADSEKPKKRAKKLRRQQSTASDKTSTASHPQTKTTSESRQVEDARPDKPDSNAHPTPTGKAQAGNATKKHDAVSPERENVAEAVIGPKESQISRERTEDASKNKKDTQTVSDISHLPSAKNISSGCDIDTSHTPKSRNVSKPVHPGTSEIRKSDSTGNLNSASRKHTTPPSAPREPLKETAATSQHVASIKHTRIDSQRDLAITQTVPSFLPPDRPRLPRSSDPAVSTRHAVNNDDAGTPGAKHKQASKATSPTCPTATAAQPEKDASSDIEMEENAAADEGQLTGSVPVKVAIRPKNTQGEVSALGGVARSQVQTDVVDDHAGTARNANGASQRKEISVRKRNRESGEAVDEATEQRPNGEARQKRPKPSGTPEGARDSASPERANTLTYFPDGDPALTTLVSRRLNPMEKHLRSLANDVQVLTSEVQNQQKSNDSLMDTFRQLKQDIRNEVSSIREEMRVVEADRREKQDELLGLIHELKTEIASISRSRPVDHSGHPTAARGAAPNGYNVQSSRYQRQPGPRKSGAPGPTASVRQVSDQRAPVQDSTVARGRPVGTGVEGSGINSDEDVNVSPRRVAAPISSAARGPAELNPTKVSQPPSDTRDRIISLVARQMTVWLLETPHEYNPVTSFTVDEWAKRTSAGAFERVANRLSHFEDYAQAYQTLSTSLGNDSVELSWFTNPSNRLNISRARSNYTAWDPPPTDAEWNSECILLSEVAQAFHRVLETHVWGNEDDLSAAVTITDKASTSYGFRRNTSTRHPSGGTRASRPQPHRSSHASHLNGGHFVRASR